MGGKVSAEYYRAWRASHPEYRARQNALRNARRASRGRGDRTAEYRARSKRRNGDIGSCLESSIVRRAKQLAATVKRPDYRTVLWDDTYEDLVGVCILALCEGHDPKEAMREWLRLEWGYRFRRAPFIDG